MPDLTAIADDPLNASRLAVLARTAILDTPPEPRFDAIVAVVKALFDVPIALVSLVDLERQWFKASIGVDMCETSINTSVCALAIRQSELFVIPDLSLDPRTRDFSLVTGEAGLRFYAGFPIITSGGVAVGSLCAIDTVPRPGGVTAQQAIALEALARQVAIEIERDKPAGDAEDSKLPYGIGSWDWDIVNDRMTADARFAAILGVTADYAGRGVTLAEFLDTVHADDRMRVRAAIEAAVAGTAPFSCEYRLRLAGGISCWVLAQGRVVRSADGTPMHLPGATFNIDARRSAEQRLAALVELGDRLRESGDAESLALAAARILGGTLDVSRAGYVRIDPDSDVAIIGEHWLAKGAETPEPLIEMRRFGTFIDDLKLGRTVTIGDVHVDPRTADYAEAMDSYSLRSLVNVPLIENGRLVAMLIVNDDMPRQWKPEELRFIADVAERVRHAVERRRAELELAQLNASLEAEVEARTRDLIAAEERLRQSLKMEAVGQLTGGLAHDFNNLLTGIGGAVEMIQRRIGEGRSDGIARYGEAAQGAVRRAAALTHRLLAFSRRQTLDPTTVRINALISGIEEMIRRTVGPAIVVEVAAAPGLWTVLADHNQLENALLNLCINARDAMPEGGRIVISTGNIEFDAEAAAARDLEPGQFVMLMVTDTGTGMTPEVQARAFDPFYTTKSMGEGTGLGLSMIYGFARQSGGQVAIDSAPGRGTTMSLVLPRHHGEAGTDDALSAIVLVDPEVLRQARTVLVVDDEETIRMLVSEAMEELGCRVLSAADGLEALRIIEEEQGIDLVVTDVGLPGAINGRQIADAVRAAIPTAKVLIITGYAEQAVIGDRPLDPGTVLLTKPFEIGQLSSRVREMLS